MESKSKALKCVFVGAGSSGKTTIIHTLANGGKHPKGENDIPYYKEVNLTAEFMHQGVQYNLGLVDTSHKEEADRSRPLAYPDTDVFVVCFTPVRHGSLADARWHWSKEVAHHCPDKPIILLALKIDLRTDPDVIKMFDSARQGEINTPAEGTSIAEEIGAERYLECSAVTGEGIQALFETFVDVGINGKSKKKSGNNKGGKSKTKECNIM